MQDQAILDKARQDKTVQYKTLEDNRESKTRSHNIRQYQIVEEKRIWSCYENISDLLNVHYCILLTYSFVSKPHMILFTQSVKIKSKVCIIMSQSTYVRHRICLISIGNWHASVKAFLS